ncbi:hypothetical protein BH09BAC3_BH09BAC3_20700 [soil metagenome]
MEDNQNQGIKNEKKGIRHLFSMGEVFGYFFRKKDPSRPDNVNIKIMHGINKISIIIFLLAVIYLIAKRLF